VLQGVDAHATAFASFEQNAALLMINRLNASDVATFNRIVFVLLFIVILFIVILILL
jgi:hypothetical protein